MKKAHICPTKAVKVYTGKGDQYQFGNSDSFAGEKSTGKEFGFDIENTDATDKIVALSYAQFTALATLNKKFSSAQVLLKDGTTTGIVVTAHNPNDPVDEFIKFMNAKPLRVISLAIDSNNKENFNFNIEQYTEVSPITDSVKQTIGLRKFVGAQDFQTDRVDIDLLKNGTPLEFSDESVILLKIAKTSKMSIRMGIGAWYSAPAHLAKDAQEAKEYFLSKGFSF